MAFIKYIAGRNIALLFKAMSCDKLLHTERPMSAVPSFFAKEGAQGQVIAGARISAAMPRRIGQAERECPVPTTGPAGKIDPGRTPIYCIPLNPALAVRRLPAPEPDLSAVLAFSSDLSLSKTMALCGSGRPSMPYHRWALV